MSRRAIFSTALGAAVALVSAPLAYAAGLDVSGEELNFGADSGDEQTGDILNNAVVGDTYTYTGVVTVDGVSVNATAEILEVVNFENGDGDPQDVIDEFDKESTSGKEIDYDFRVTDAGEGYATFSITFSQALSNLQILVQDIDSRQFVTFSSPTSYVLDSSTELRVTESGGFYEFREPDGNSSEDTDEENWVIVNYATVTTLTIKAGAREAGGGEVDFQFRPASLSNPVTVDLTATPREEGSDPEPASSPAIHLDIEETLGAAVGSTPVLFEGEGLARNTPYTLRLGPSGQVLGSGEVDRFGYFSQRVNLPSGLASGNYYVTLSTNDPAGNPLSLTQSFTVGAGGVITSVSATTPAVSGDVLARTGPNSTALAWGVGGLAGLSVLGVALMLAGYAHTSRRPQLAPVVTPQR